MLFFAAASNASPPSKQLGNYMGVSRSRILRMYSSKPHSYSYVDGTSEDNWATTIPSSPTSKYVYICFLYKSNKVVQWLITDIAQDSLFPPGLSLRSALRKKSAKLIGLEYLNWDRRMAKVYMVDLPESGIGLFVTIFYNNPATLDFRPTGIVFHKPGAPIAFHMLGYTTVPLPKDEWRLSKRVSE